MTPKTEGETVTSLGLPFLYEGTMRHRIKVPVGRTELKGSGAKIHKNRMTLCGSEVPQDRWRGRTAGSGMWTLTRDNLLSWSLDDPAIPYG